MIQISEHAEALLALNNAWCEENTKLLALQRQARQLANQITATQRRQYALQQSMAKIITNHGKPVYTAADLT